MSRAWYLHPAAVVFKVTGRDARRYLNNRLSHDLRTLQSGQALTAGALSPQGRVEGFYTVYVESDESFHLVADGGQRQPLFAALGRYIVADRVSIVDCSAEAVAGHIAGDLDPSLVSVPDAASFRAPRRRIASTGTDFLIVAKDVSGIGAILHERLGTPLSTAHYDTLRFSQGFVQYPQEINDSIILTEAGLRDSVSFSKGCYVGQEVIERIDAIGKLPRRVERIIFRDNAPISVQSTIVGRDQKSIGKVVSVFSDDAGAGTKVFALLKSGAYAANDEVNCEGTTGRILSQEEETV